MEKYGSVLLRRGAMRRCEEESSDGELSFIRSVPFFVVVCGKVQNAEVPTRKLAGEPVQGYGRDYELLIGFFVDWLDGAQCGACTMEGEFVEKVIAVVRVERKKKVLAEVVVQDLPNFIMSKLGDYLCFHKLWANSCAMEKCGSVLLQ